MKSDVKITNREPQVPYETELETLFDEGGYFVGQCGTGPENELYGIGYECIFLVNDPYTQWSSPGCRVKIDYFVDLKIEITKQ